MQAVSTEICINNLAKSMASRRIALQIELSVGLSIFAQHGEASQEAKSTLSKIYADAGWRCLTPKEMDYKTVNRRINATASLFEKIGIDEVTSAIASNKDQRAINAVAKHLEQYKLFTVNDVLAFVDKQATPRKPRTVKEGPRRRWTDEERASAKRIDLGPIHWVIPPESRRRDLIEAARKLLEIADEFDNGNAHGKNGEQQSAMMH